MKNIFFLSLLTLSSFAHAASGIGQEKGKITVDNVLYDTASVLEISGYTAAGTVLGIMGTAGLALLSSIRDSKHRSVSVVGGLLGVASYYGAKKSYEKAFAVYKNMKTDSGKEIAKYTAVLNALGLSSALGFKSCIALANWIANNK